MKRALKWLVCGFLVIGFVGIAYAQFSKPEDAIEYRQADMVMIAHHFGRIAAVVKGKVPYDQKAVAKDAALVDTLSQLPWEAFMVPGAEKGRTHLNAKAFSKDKAGFQADADALMTQAAKLAKVAADGNLDAVKGQFGAVGQSCKACHGTYRSR